MDHPDPDISDPWSSTLFYDRYERWNPEDADALQRIDEKLLPLLPENKEVLERLNVSDPKAGNVSNYIERNACYPVYQNTDVTYYDEAAKGLEAQLIDLAKAEHFIFMEYHAIEDAEAWQRIQHVLEEQ